MVKPMNSPGNVPFRNKDIPFGITGYAMGCSDNAFAPFCRRSSVGSYFVFFTISSNLGIDFAFFIEDSHASAQFPNNRPVTMNMNTGWK